MSNTHGFFLSSKILLQVHEIIIPEDKQGLSFEKLFYKYLRISSQNYLLIYSFNKK